MRTDGDWRERGACVHGNPELFFPIGTTGPADQQVSRAKQVCAPCSVRAACLKFAVTMGIDDGVWGGLSEEERRAAKRRKARSKCAPTGVR